MIKEITDLDEALNTLNGIDGGQINSKFIRLLIEEED